MMSLISKRQIVRAMARLIFLYLLLNAGLTCLVTIIHSVSLEITVLDNASDLPLEGVEMTWVELYSKPFGVTDETGQFKHNMMIQAQPLLFFPKVGWYSFHDRTLRLTKEGYESQEIELSKESRLLSPFGTTVVPLTVTMKRVEVLVPSPEP